MRIGMILNGNYPSDIRVRKEAETLAENHNIFILCKKSPEEKAFEIINNVIVVRNIEYKSLVHEGIVDVLSSINFIHPLFKKNLLNFIVENKIEALHVHDLPLAKTVYLIGEKLKLKLILDLHENYPAALKTWFSWRKNPIIRLKNYIFFGYKRWSKYEADIIKKYDIVITVVDEMKERLKKQHEIEGKKIIVVPNSEKKEFARNFDISLSNYFENESDKFIISYVGGFGPHRGLHTAILGMKNVSQKIPNSLLVLIGPVNKDVKEYLNNLIVKNKLEKFVRIKEKEPFKNVINIMKSSDINIIPHISNEHTESAVPHKFFQILLSKKPLLVSDCAPMKRLIKANNIGTFFKAEDSNSFADKVIDIHFNYEKMSAKASVGYEQALNGNLNWEQTSKSLIRLYDNLSN
jgi:glycosyltransferase involved in cell wall biosynthesis